MISFSFLIIASGSFACVVSGILSQYWGSKRIAFLSLLLSCLCCLSSPLFLYSHSPAIAISFLFFWGIVVIADSPLFSTLVSRSSPEESRGSAITIVNCIGFGITILSIQCINLLTGKIDSKYIFTFLAIGPILGLVSLWNYQTDDRLQKVSSR